MDHLSTREKIKVQLPPDQALFRHSFAWRSRVIEALERLDAIRAHSDMLHDAACVMAHLIQPGAEREKTNESKRGRSLSGRPGKENVPCVHTMNADKRERIKRPQRPRMPRRIPRMVRR